jgi:hypothetical protein
MKLRQLGFALILVLSTLTSKALVISEVLYNEVGSDTTGEWIEIYNNTGLTIDLSSYKIGDEETSGGTSATEALFQFPFGVSIAPGEVQVIAVSATRFNTVYGFLPTYELLGDDLTVPDLTVYAAWDPDGGVINMSNSNDQSVLVDGSDTIVDAVSWGNAFAFSPGLDPDAELDGQSYERISLNLDTDTASDWQLGFNSATAALRSSPGVVPEPSALVLFGMGILGFFTFRSRRLKKD